MLDHIGCKCQLWEKVVVNQCFVIDVRSYCFFEVCFPALSPTEIVRNQCWSQFNTSTDNNTYCVGALWDSGREGLCSFNGRLNECVRCMAFTALFTFLDHMEILLHYILTKSSVWLGGRERRQESAPVFRTKYVCHVIQSPSCLMGKWSFCVCIDCIALSWMAFSVRGWACLFCNRCFAVVSIWPILTHLPCLFLKETESSCSESCFKIKG